MKENKPTVEELRQKYIEISSSQTLSDQRESLMILQEMFLKEDKELKKEGKIERLDPVDKYNEEEVKVARIVSRRRGK